MGFRLSSIYFFIFQLLATARLLMILESIPITYFVNISKLNKVEENINMLEEDKRVDFMAMHESTHCCLGLRVFIFRSYDLYCVHGRDLNTKINDV